MQITGMKTSRTRYANDNEPNSWSSIGWQAAMIVNRLRCQAHLLELQTDKQKDENAPDNRERGDRREKNSDSHEKYVDQRLRELAAFERRISGRKDRT